MRTFLCCVAVLLVPVGEALAQRTVGEVLRGEVAVDMEPVYLIRMGLHSPVDTARASAWALEDSAAAFSGMIYGWDFEYEPGERARGLSERITLFPLGTVPDGDPRIKITEAQVRDRIYYLWCDFEMNPEQQFRLKAWNAGNTKEVKAMGHAPLEGPVGSTERSQIKRAALEDAMKKALRFELRAEERNRPRIVRGSIALARFPLYRIFHGNWAAQASFRVHISEIVPFAVY